jgi:hypothetical protein
MRGNLGKAIAIALVAAACGPSPRDHGDDNGPDAGTGDPGGDASDNNNNSNGCSEDAKLVYVVDSDKTLSQFDPKTQTFKDLGQLACTGSASPFSMAIARDATAWVLYDNGDLYHVDTKNNLACTKSPWVRGAQGETKFGMGFSTDQVGGTADTLFISGGSSPDSATSSTLAKVDMSTFQPTKLGSVTGWPELTGTGSAELWGFFPADPGYTSARVLQLNKANGSVQRTFPLGDLNGAPNAWAFAFHGGSFWVFLKRDYEDYTWVHQISGATGALVGSREAVGRKIVGAGVSTCAPVVIF